MRIVSGQCKGRLITPPSNLKARPTTDFAKENLFNIIGNRYDFEGLKILDLFAGTGSISYEFASRGAESVLSIEANHVHTDFIRGTAKKLGLPQIRVTKYNVFRFVEINKEKYDIIFADPPYDLESTESLPDIILSREMLAENGCLIFEHGKDKDFSTHPRFTEIRNYGSVHFSFFE